MSEPIDSLDAAWAAAEAALPEGRQLQLEYARPGLYVARYQWLTVVVVDGTQIPASSTWRWSEGPTPAAALRALAARLEEAK